MMPAIIKSLLLVMFDPGRGCFFILHYNPMSIRSCLGSGPLGLVRLAHAQEFHVTKAPRGANMNIPDKIRGLKNEQDANPGRGLNADQKKDNAV